MRMLRPYGRAAELVCVVSDLRQQPVELTPAWRLPADTSGEARARDGRQAVLGGVAQHVVVRIRFAPESCCRARAAHDACSGVDSP
jgi:hypothetical protein